MRVKGRRGTHDVSDTDTARQLLFWTAGWLDAEPGLARNESVAEIGDARRLFIGAMGLVHALPGQYGDRGVASEPPVA